MAKKLDEVKWSEINWIKCGMGYDRMLGKFTPVCSVHTIDGELYQVEPKAMVFGLEQASIVLKE